MTQSRVNALKAFLALVWLVSLYRAITQAIVHDEALTYQLYLAAPWSAMFQLYDANHHFLNTLLMRLSVSLFGASELSLRLPALAGAALYLTAVYRICAVELRRAPAAFAGAALLVLNPFVLDFLVAARGYGMALGFWMWALAILAGYLRKPGGVSARELFAAGAALGLSVMANLVFVVPAAVLMLATWAILKSPWHGGIRPPDERSGQDALPKSSKKRRQRRVRPALSPQQRALGAFWRWVTIPAVAGWLLMVAVFPVGQAKAGDFYAGAATAAASLRSLYEVSLANGGPLRPSLLRPELRDAIAFGLAPAILLFALILGIRRRRVLLILPAGIAAGCAFLLLGLHLAVHLLYPLDRTGIYFLPLVALALVALADETDGLGAAALCLSVVAAGLFLQEFQTRRFTLWSYDADTPALLRQLASRVPHKRPASIRIANSWQLEPALNFYAARFHDDWLQPITRAPLAPGADYYLLMEMDRDALARLHLRTLYTGPTSGTVLAAP